MPRRAGWSDLKLRTKGLITIAVPATATVMIACASYVLGDAAAGAEQQVRASLRIQAEIARLQTFEIEASARARAYFMTGQEASTGQAGEALARFDSTREKLAGLIEADPIDQQQLSSIAALEQAWMENISGATARFQAGALTPEQARAASLSVEAQGSRMESLLRDMDGHEKNLLDARMRSVDRLRSILSATTSLCMLFGVAGGVVISWLYGAGITQRIRRLQENVARLATGGALDPLPGGRDEIGALAEGVARTAETLEHRTAALENALHGIAEADGAGRYRSFNAAYAELAGLGPGARPAGVLETVEPGDRARVEHAIAAMRENGRAVIEGRIQRSDGSLVPVEMTFLPALAGRDAGFYVFLRDISLQKKVEAALVEAKDAAVSSNLARTQFLAKIGHDIRTPLNVILGAADLLAESGLNSRQSEYASMFQRNCKHLVGLINDFLDFSKIEAGALRVERIAFRIQETLDGAAATFRDLAARKGVELRVYVDPGLPESVLGDPLRIEQVLVNLLSNALKFTNQGRVEVRVVKTADGPGDRLQFEVSDSGPGISVADQARIFAAFTQLPQQTSIGTHGAGLGLAICSELVTLMGGEIGVDSAEGRGSRFRFTLPLEAAPMALARPERLPVATISDSEPPKQAVRVLVAEDTEDNRLLIEHYARGEKIEIEFAENGQKAVDAIQGGKKFDLILMDIDMPVLDGIEATKAIRRWEIGRGAAPIPIVALSAHAMREAVRACLEAGCVAHVAKPLDRSMLFRTVYLYALTTTTSAAETPSRQDQDVQALVPMYLASKPQQIEQARDSLSRNEFEPIRRFGHNLKGTGGGYGFPLIEDLGREIERAAQQADAGRIAGQLEALLRFVNESAAKLNEDSRQDATCSN